MSDKTGHLILGTILGVILIIYAHYFWGWFDLKSLSLVNIGLLIGIIYVYSLIEDIDTRASTIVWTFIPIGLIMAIAGHSMNNSLYLGLGLGLITVTFIFAQFFPHRGFAHSIVFGILVSLPWMYLSYQYAVLAFVCFYSHLILDEEFLKLV